jgi:predicted nucleic acid-binding protein
MAAGRFTVVLDACVLYPAPLRDLLMQLTAADLFRARWTDQIHAEWMRNLLANRPDLKRADLERVRDLMNIHARDSLVSGYEAVIELIENCPDADDRHVIAAAYHAQADAIVTFNLKDFPAAALEPYGLEAIHPDDFLRYQLDLDLARVLESVRTCRARLKNPPKSVSDYLDTLEAQSLPKTVAALRSYAVFL